MTHYSETLFTEALSYWLSGLSIPLELYASMAAEGMNVPALEARYINN